MNKKTRIESATVRWDTETDPKNPGWVIDVTYEGGRKDTIAPSPDMYYRPKNADRNILRRHSLAWHGLELKRMSKA